MKAIHAVIEQIWGQFDVDDSGKLDKAETKKFVDATLGNLGKGKGKPSDDAFEKLFKTFDDNQNGEIERNEMGNFLRDLLLA